MEAKTGSEGAQRESISELLGRLADSSAALVRDEVELVKQQAREMLKDLRNGVIMLVAGGVLIIGAVWSLIAALIIVLSLYMPAGCAAAMAALVLILAGGIMGYIGIRQLKSAPKQLKQEEVTG